MVHVSDLIAVVPWLLPFATLPRLTSRKPDLTDAPAVGGRLVTVIIPARNEASTIEMVVRSILATEYHPLELVVVDDRSSDDTAAIVARLADPRLRLIAGEELPDGWYGKPWACYQGYQAAGGELLLFTDADTRHAPALLGHAVGALIREGAGLVTVSPLQRCVSFWERVVMPQIWFLLALRYAPASVNRARTERDVIANGQFILTTREAYEAAGTHFGVRHEVAEDLALAQAFVRRGQKLYFAYAESLMETRMYQSLRQMIEGWSKNIYLGGRRSFPHQPLLRALVPLMLVVALGFWLVPPAILLAGAIHPAVGAFTLPALIGTVMSALFWMQMARLMQIPAPYGAAYPLGAMMALFIVGRSTWRGGGKVEWRGRTYRH